MFEEVYCQIVPKHKPSVMIEEQKEADAEYRNLQVLGIKMEPMTQGETNYIQVHLRILEDNDAIHIF